MFWFWIYDEFGNDNESKDYASLEDAQQAAEYIREMGGYTSSEIYDDNGNEYPVG